MSLPTFRAATCHVAPTFLFAGATTDRCISLIHSASRNNANLVVFPESHIPGFPLWSALRPPTENHDLFRAFARESLTITSDEITAIRAAAKHTGTLISLGFSERAPNSTATLFNSNLLIGPDGDILVHHRKLVPTFFEKLTWSPGDGYGLQVAETRFGRVGALICGENTNPLARYALMAFGEQVHVSSWPAVWPTRALREVEGGAGREGNYDNVAANRIRAAAHCFEAKCFGVVSAGFLGEDAVSKVAEGAGDAEGVRRTLTRSPRAASMFLDPTGALLPGFTVNERGGHECRDFLQNEEGVLYADMDLEQCVEGKQYHDVTGGYQRTDIFKLKVNRERKGAAVFEDGVD